jgi:medium-chain acyl-[acyl-carrier-protein] hydrolase
VSVGERWVYRTEQAQPALRLFTFAYAGGSAGLFDRWQDDLAGVAEVCAVELPGRRARYREPLVTDVPALVERIAAGVAPLVDVPYALFGHSFGALLAFEVARSLHRRGLPGPRALLASAAHAPHRLRIRRRLSDLPDEQFVDEIVAFGALPADLRDDPEILGQYVPIVRADFVLYESYRYEPGPPGEGDTPLAVPLFLYGARDDGQVDQDLLLAWGELFDDVRSLELFEGGHFFCHERRAELTATVRRDLTTL